MRVAAAGGSGVGGSKEGKVDATVGAAEIVTGGAAGGVGTGSGVLLCGVGVAITGVRKWLSNGSVTTGRGEGVGECGREVLPCATLVKTSSGVAEVGSGVFVTTSVTSRRRGVSVILVEGRLVVQLANNAQDKISKHPLLVNTIEMLLILIRGRDKLWVLQLVLM